MAMEMRVSVRSLVEFVLRNGDLDNRAGAAPEEAMLAGARMHRRLQKQAGPDYRSEVPLRCRWEYTEPWQAERMPGAVSPASASADLPGGTAAALPSPAATQQVLPAQPETAGFRPFSVLVEGRADGIFTGRLPDDPSSEEGPVIDEIKSTYRNLARMTEPDPVHLAQARCYAWMYCAEQRAEFVYVRLSYVNLDNEDIHYFYEKQTREELAAWFGALMREYQKWAEYTLLWLEKRQASIRALAFPFPYREGQRELAGHVYRTIVHGRKLFLEAPTGTGKTIAALFPALKAMGEGKAERIFYLTARTVAGSVAEDTLQFCRAAGLAAKSVTLTAKEKLCVLGRPDCNPDACPRAQGHYDRINRAIYELLTQADNFDRGAIEACAEKHNVCPFEMTLDMSLFSDVVIGDYNYVFDPHVYLRRFFGEGELRRAYLFLVDEAHNLVDRGREMYSAALDQSFLEGMEAVLRGTRQELADRLEVCLLALGALRSQQQTEALLVRGEDETAAFHDAAAALHGQVGKWLEEERRRARRRVRKPSRKKKELQEKILNLYFELSHYLLIRDLMDEHYRIYTEFADGSFRIRLFCVDPGKNLQRCMERGVSSILFSATLLPIQYYKKLLGGGPEDYEVYARSVFDPERRALLIARDVTSRYARRGPEQYDRLARCIHYMTSGRHGNYLVFFPSFAFLREVAEVYVRRYQDVSVTECIRQQERMDEAERSAFLARFAQSSDEHTLIGFAVLGGIFSEGIDLRRDSLIGAAVVGTGIPQVCGERELLREYFNETGVNGYDYAYCFPGMNKVMQAAGRVIRTQQDIGVIALLDERFLTSGYRRLFPREWSDYEEVSTEEIPGRIDRFWNEWL